MLPNVSLTDHGQPVSHPRTIVVDCLFRAYLAAAVVRLGYLYPTISFAVCDDGIGVEGDVEDFAELRRDVLHAVYRERIFTETLPLRRTLIDGLLA